MERLGIDPAAEQGLTLIDVDEVEGRFLADPDDRGIVIGQGAAFTSDFLFFHFISDKNKKKMKKNK